MKKTSRKPTLSSLKTTASLVVLAIIVLCLLLWRSFFSGLLWRAAAPILSVNPLSGLFAQFHTKAALVRENERLSAEVASQTAQIADRDLLYQENLELKSRFARDASVHTLLAGVVARPPAVPYDTLMLDAGSAQGVAIGDRVAAGGSTLIGTIEDVYPQTSRVKLFSAPGESYDALLHLSARNGSVVPVEVAGQGGGSFVAQVPAGTPVIPGDSLVLSGSIDGYLGAVSSVSAPVGESFETVYMHLPVEPEELRYVEVWRGSSEVAPHAQ